MSRLSKGSFPSTPTEVKGVPTKAMREKRLMQLNEPERVTLICRHRSVGSVLGVKPSEDRSRQSEFGKRVPTQFTPIHLNQIDKKVDQIYLDTFINLTLIDEPMMGVNSVSMLAEDENGDVTIFAIHEIPHTDFYYELLAFGTQLAVVHPHHTFEWDRSVGIVVDVPEEVVLLGKKESMCRYCMKENALKKCSKCHKATYCSRECQVNDWSELKHRLICKKLKN